MIGLFFGETNFPKEILKKIKKKKINYIKKYLIDNYKIKLDYLELRNEKDLSIFKKN